MMLLWRTTINLEVLKKMNKINESARRIARKSRLHTLEKETRKVGFEGTSGAGFEKG